MYSPLCVLLVDLPPLLPFLPYLLVLFLCILSVLFPFCQSLVIYSLFSPYSFNFLLVTFLPLLLFLLCFLPFILSVLSLLDFSSLHLHLSTTLGPKRHWNKTGNLFLLPSSLLWPSSLPRSSIDSPWGRGALIFLLSPLITLKIEVLLRFQFLWSFSFIPLLLDHYSTYTCSSIPWFPDVFIDLFAVFLPPLSPHCRTALFLTCLLLFCLIMYPFCQFVPFFFGALLPTMICLRRCFLFLLTLFLHLLQSALSILPFLPSTNFSQASIHSSIYWFLFYLVYDLIMGILAFIKRIGHFISSYINRRSEDRYNDSVSSSSPVCQPWLIYTMNRIEVDEETECIREIMIKDDRVQYSNNTITKRTLY